MVGGALSICVPDRFLPLRSNCSAADEKAEEVSIYLSAESRHTLSEHLNGILSQDTGSVNVAESDLQRVVIKRQPSTIDNFVYQRMFGERMAFRLKGILKTDMGYAAVGRVSNTDGEVFDSEYETSLAIPIAAKKGKEKEKEKLLMDLPTRFFQNRMVSDSNSDKKWTGSIPAGTVQGITYPKMDNVTFIQFPFEDQIVIDGHICSSCYRDTESGACTFDRSTLPENIPEAAAKRLEERQELMVASMVHFDPELAKETCPVCKFMKAGACKAAYETWDDCIQNLKEDEDLRKCYGGTVAMMECMKQYEYYDIMTANSSKKVETVAEGGTKQEVSKKTVAASKA